MIPNFNTYNLINESITLQELSKGNEKNYSYGDMKGGFLSKGYEFLNKVFTSFNVIFIDHLMCATMHISTRNTQQCG